jgi:hypothetical protein
MARDRVNIKLVDEENDHNDLVTTGGTGFGIMGIIVAAERGWICREQASDRVLQIVKFLSELADVYHGVFPHWLDGNTGKTINFSASDDGSDLVETAFLFQGLITARQYFDDDKSASEIELRDKILTMWENVEWTFHQQNGQNALYWHWSPTHGFSVNIQGWNECLITYVLAASSPKHAIDSEVYGLGWATGDTFSNGKEFYNVTLPLGVDYGGPLFFSHYSFLGLNPYGLKDKNADYWQQNVAHTRINYEYCIDNPKNFTGYGPNCWGLTASDSYPHGDESRYEAHSPTNDLSVISPTAALSAMPYSPNETMTALRYFYDDLGDELWTEYGFVDAFSQEMDWYAQSHLAIDQGPIIVMIENHRNSLLWHLFMSCADVQSGLSRLGFEFVIPNMTSAKTDEGGSTSAGTSVRWSTRLGIIISTLMSTMVPIP